MKGSMQVTGTQWTAMPSERPRPEEMASFSVPMVIPERGSRFTKINRSHPRGAPASFPLPSDSEHIRGSGPHPHTVLGEVAPCPKVLAPVWLLFQARVTLEDLECQLPLQKPRELLLPSPSVESNTRSGCGQGYTLSSITSIHVLWHPRAVFESFLDRHFQAHTR